MENVFPTNTHLCSFTSVDRLVAHLVDLEGLDGGVFSAVVLKSELSAFVKGTAEVGLPFGWIWFVHSLLVFSRLQSPSLPQ